MALQSSFYNTDGTTRTYPSTKHIATKQHVSVYGKRVSDSTWVILAVDLYELVNNSIVFDTAPDTVIYSQIEVRVADTAIELEDSPSDIAIVAGIAANVSTVAGNTTNINTVATNIGAVQTVSGAIANVNTVATNVANVNTVATNITSVNTVAANIVDVSSVADTIVPNIAEILLADTNATTATTQAGIATTKANEATASALEAEHWANYTVDVAVPEGTGEFSAKHYATKAAESAASLITDAVPTDGSTNAVSSNGVFDALALKAPLVSPSLSGVPTAPTATIGTNTQQIATTEFVMANSNLSQDFRLTLTTSIPVTTSNVTAATSIYLTPYIGNKLSIYDGSSWITYTTAELSIAVPATTNTMYDVFVYSNAGTPTLELTAWTNDTTRATALVKQDGVYVKSGATTRRYLGSFRTTGVSGQTEDSLAKRYVWNYYNRVIRAMYVTDATVSWVYTTDTWRQANANAANQLDFVIGVNEDLVRAFATHAVLNSGTAGRMLTGIGLDITNAPSNLLSTNGSTAGTTMMGTPTAEFASNVAAGRHFLAWLEYSTAVGTSTWTTNQTKVGIQGEVLG